MAAQQVLSEVWLKITALRAEPFPQNRIKQRGIPPRVLTRVACLDQEIVMQFNID
jgi:hypothetical protein